MKPQISLWGKQKKTLKGYHQYEATHDDDCDVCHQGPKGEIRLNQIHDGETHIGWTCDECKPRIENISAEEFTIWRITRKLEQA